MSERTPEQSDRRVTLVGRTIVGLAMVVLFFKIGGVSSPGYGSPKWMPWTWRPGPLFRDTLATGGDTGAHVWTPWFVRRNLLSSFRATGWSKDWFAGFPVLHFYFPLPSWAIVALGFVMNPNVAFKLVTVAGILTLPLAAMVLARTAGLARHYRYLFALASMVSLYNPLYVIFGGNILSTFAGEFSFSISLAGAVTFLALLVRVMRTGRGRALAVVPLVVAALSHLLPTVFAAAGAVVVLLVHLPMAGPTARVRRVFDVAIVGVTGALLACFWIVPFGAHLAYSNDMGWETATNYMGSLIPALNKEKASGAAIMTVVVLLGLVGGVHQSGRFVRALIKRSEPDSSARVGMMFSLLAVGAALAFRFPPAFRILNERALPFYFLSCCFLAAFAVDLLARKLAPVRRLGVTAFVCWWFVGANLAITPGFLPIPKLHKGTLGIQRADATDDINLAAQWAKENYDGYQAVEDWPEHQTIIRMMTNVGKTYGCGRAMWEWEQGLDRYGSDVAFMLLPYWTKGCVGSMEGMYYESSATGPSHWINSAYLATTGPNPQSLLAYPTMNVAEGVYRLQQWGVRYFMALSPKVQEQARTNPDLRFLSSVPYTRDCEPDEITKGDCPSTMEAYEVLRSPLVEGLSTQPAVVTGIDPSQRGGWLDVAMAQFGNPAAFPVPLAADGPSTWTRVAATFRRGADVAYGAQTQVATAPAKALAAVSVTDIVEGQGDITFHVDRVGVPVVVKESYFPTWRATGAQGPWRLAPNMMVVIPTSKDVRLRVERDGADWLGLGLTGVGLVSVAALAFGPRLRRGSRSPAESAEPGSPPSVHTNTDPRSEDQ